MKIKKPSLKGMKNCEYLGHFAKDEYIQQGHNFSGKPPLSDDEIEKRDKEYIKTAPTADLEVKREQLEKRVDRFIWPWSEGKVPRRWEKNLGDVLRELNRRENDSNARKK